VVSVQDDENGYSGGGDVDGDGDEEEITVEVVEMLRAAQYNSRTEWRLDCL